jgi:hypothetical protein
VQAQRAFFVTPQSKPSGDGGVRPRPAIFRALGRNEPPPVVEIRGEPFRMIELLKHDSWAATAIYESADRRALCKFNRQQSILGFPMRWLGRLLASREQAFHARLDGIPGIAPSLGAVTVAGSTLPHAVARTFIDGHALAEGEWVDERFFPRFQALLAEVHRRGVAHVDLHKRENILVAADGRPFLIDFQISFALPSSSPLAARALGGLLGLLQRCDDYHLLKHQVKHRPDQAGLTIRDLEQLRPWWIRLHRQFAVPFRTFRRGLLVRLGIRSACGHAFSESFPEIAHRRAAA